MIVPSITVDTSKFDLAFKEYLQYSKKSMSDIVNTKAYFIARNAVNTTDTVDKSKIEHELRKPSNTDPRAPLAAIICAIQQNRTRVSKSTGKQLKDKGGLYGPSMTTAINKLIRIRQSTRNFLRSGWIPAIKLIEKFVEKKSGPSYVKVKTKGADKGGAKGSPKSGDWKAVASIWNSVTGGIKMHGLKKQLDPAKVQHLLEKGLQKAIDKETASMKEYVEKKMNTGAAKFNRT